MPKKSASKRTYAPARKAKTKATKRSVAAAAPGWWDKEKKKSAGLKLCTRCDAVWYDAHWHTAPNLAAALKAKRKAGKPAKDVFCEECRYVMYGPADPKSALFAGELTLDGLLDASVKAKVLATVRAVAKRASKRDSQDRIVDIDDRGERVVVTTTKNQLAAALGKAVDSAFKGGKLRIVWSSDDLPARVHWKSKEVK